MNQILKQTFASMHLLIKAVKFIDEEDDNANEDEEEDVAIEEDDSKKDNVLSEDFEARSDNPCFCLAVSRSTDLSIVAEAIGPLFKKSSTFSLISVKDESLVLLVRD